MMGALSQRNSRGWWLIVFRWAAALIILGVLLHFRQLAPLRAAIARVSIYIFLAAQAGLVLLGFVLLPELELVPENVEDTVDDVLLAIGVGVVLVLALTFAFRKRVLRGRSVRFRRRLARFRHALRSVSKKPRALVLGWLFGTCIQMAFLMLTAQLAAYCGLRLPLRSWLFAWPLAKLAAVLPLTQGGIGVREAALVGLLAPFGAPAHLVLAAGLVWEGVVIAGGLITGVVALVLRRRANRG